MILCRPIPALRFTALLQYWLRTVVMAPGFLNQKIGLANHLYQVHENDVVSDEGEASIYDLGKAFPDFLDNTKPKPAEGIDNSHFEIPAALARVEWARQVAMRAPGFENNAVDTSQVNIQDMLFGTFNISVPECLQLLKLDFPMKQFFEAI